MASAESVADALAVLHRECFDVVLADLALPNEDGFALLRAIREERLLTSQERPIPVLAVTGQSGRADHRSVIVAGFELHLVKPVDAGDLVLAVRLAVEGRSAEFGTVRAAVRSFETRH